MRQGVRSALAALAGAALIFFLTISTISGVPVGAVEGSFELRPAGPEANPPLPGLDVFPVQLVIDDDQQEGALGVVGAGGALQFLWFNRFTRPAGTGSFRLEEIWVLFPGSGNAPLGGAIDLAVYLDPDGDPSNGADLLAVIPETIQAADDLNFSVYPLAVPVEIAAAGEILIGVIPRFIVSGVTPPVSPASLDLTAPQGRSWFAIWIGDPPAMPTLPSDNLVIRIDDFNPNAAGNWMIRSFGTPFAVTEVPTLGPGMLGVLVLLLLAAGILLVRRKRKELGRGALAGLFLAFAVLIAAPAAAQITIDDFSTAQALLQVPPGTTASSTVAGGGILGSDRDLALEQTSGAGTVSAEVTGGALTFTVAAATEGTLEIVYDADSDPTTLDPVGLGGVDLTAGGASALRLNVGVATTASSVEIEVFTDGGNSSKAGLLLPVGMAQDFFVPYSAFLLDQGTGADFSNVGAIVLLIQGADATVTINEVVAEPPVLAATKADALTVDVDMDGGADPGDRLTYTVTITNTGGEALSVDLTDTVDSNTTLVAASVSATPVPKGDQYTARGNVTLIVDGSAGKPGLLANDTDPDGDTLTVASVTSPSAQGGTVMLTSAATGTFTYSAPTAFNGVDSFSYTVQDDDLNMVSATATITIDGIVWFVDNTHGGPFEGTQANPFNLFKAAEMASSADDIIRIREGDGTDTGHDLGFVLKPGQRLVGGAADLLVDGQLIEAGTSHSVHSHAAGNVLDLVGDHVIEGMILNPSTGHGAAGTGSSNLTLDGVIINPSGTAGGISLINHTGGFTFSNSSITAASTTSGMAFGVDISGGSGSFDFSGSTISKSGGGLLHIENTTGATHDFTGTPLNFGSGTHHGILLVNNTGSTTLPLIGFITTGSGDGIRISNGGTVNLDSIGPVDATGGSALDFSGTTIVKSGAPGAITFTSLASAGAGMGINLNGVAPAVTVAGTTGIAGAATLGVNLISSGATTFTGALSVGSNGAGLVAANTGTVTVSDNTSSINATGGPGLDVTNSGINLTFASLSSSGSATTGVNLNAATGGLTASGGTVTGGASGTAFQVTGGSPTSTYSGNLTQNNAQRVVNIENTTGGAVNFNTGTVTGGASSLGVRIHNAGGNSSFGDLNLGTSGSPMTNQALTLTGGSTGTHSFAGTQIFTTGANGVHADNGGVIQFTGPGNRASATNSRAVTFENGTTIGAMGVTFERTDASGSDRGIRLANAGSGFTVTGTGTTAGTGGVIQNITDRGVEVIGTNNLSLSNMNLTDAATTNGVDPTNGNGTCGGLALGQNLGCNAPVHLQTVNGATLENVHILRSAQVGINGHTVTGFALRNSTVTDAGNQTNEFSLKFRDMLGTSEITDSTVRRTVSSGTEVDQFRLQNFSSTQLNLTVTNSHFDTNAADGPTSAFENTGFIAVGHSGANMRIEVVSSFFENNKGPGLTVGVSDGSSNASVDLIVTGGTFRNNNVGLEVIGHGTNSTISFDINGATVDDNPAVGINVDLNSTSSSGVTLQGHVRNNTVTHTGSGDCIQVNTRGAGDAFVAITGNTLNESGFERAIDVSTQEGSGDLDVVITGNTLNMTGVNPLRAMNVNSGADTGDTGTMCAKVGGATAAERNTVNSIGGGDTRVRVRRRENTVVNLQGVPGPHPQANQATIEAYITSQNTGATGQATVGAGFGDATCTVPPIP